MSNHLLVVSLLCLQLSGTQAIQYPTSRYLYSVSRERQDARRRRQFARKKETISLKPPPGDWPAPTPGPGDFVLSEESWGSEMTSLAPFQAYQAKLEQELLSQKKKEADLIKSSSQKQNSSPAALTSSEEELQKLLNPEELVKHNKKLKPFINNLKRITGKSTKRSTKPAAMKSSAVIKAAKATSPKKTKRKTKFSISATTKLPSLRGRKRKATKGETVGNLAPEKGFKTGQTKTNLPLAEPSTKKKRKLRQFTFATNNYKEDIDGSVKLRNTLQEGTDQPNLQSKIKMSVSVFNISTEYPIKVQDWTTKTWVQGKSEISVAPFKNPKISTAGNTCNKTEYVLSMSEPTTSSFLSTLQLDSNVTFNSKQEITKKRKKKKQEMEEVLNLEKLEGSFGDKDEDWTTSESPKISLNNVKSRKALMGILKHKIANFIDGVLRGSPKLTEDKIKQNEEIYISWNATHGHPS